MFIKIIQKGMIYAKQPYFWAANHQAGRPLERNCSEVRNSEALLPTRRSQQFPQIDPNWKWDDRIWQDHQK